MNASISRFAILFFLFVLTITQVMMLSGCATHQLVVVPRYSNSVVVLSAEQVVTVMRRGGFSNEQIERLGPELRDALAFQGAAQIRSADYTKALFLVDGHLIYGVAHGRGGFFYDVRKEPASRQPK